MLAALTSLSTEDNDGTPRRDRTGCILYVGYAVGVCPHTSFASGAPAVAWFIKEFVVEGRGVLASLVPGSQFELQG